jgi:hypothetical protein
MHASQTRTKPNTAGKTMSITTSALLQREKTLPLAVRYSKLLEAAERRLLTAQFFLAYRSLCPSGWVERWDDQRGM